MPTPLPILQTMTVIQSSREVSGPGFPLESPQPVVRGELYPLPRVPPPPIIKEPLLEASLLLESKVPALLAEDSGMGTGGLSGSEKRIRGPSSFLLSCMKLEHALRQSGQL